MRPLDNRYHYIFIQWFLSYDHRDYEISYILDEFHSLDIADLDGVTHYMFTPWFDTSGIAGGLVWENIIRAAIRRSRLFVPVVSEEHYSKWVAKEIAIAKHRLKPILPIYLDSGRALTQYHIGHLQGLAAPKARSGGDPDFNLALRRSLSHTILGSHVLV